MRYPVKFLLITAFTIPALAALGIAHWRAGLRSIPPPKVWTIVAVFAAVAAVVCGLLGYTRQDALAPNDSSTVLQNALWRVFFLVIGVGALLIFKRSEPSARLKLLATAALFLAVTLDSLTHTPLQNPSVSPNAYASGVLASRLISPPLPDQGRVMSGRATRDFMFSSMLADTFDDYIGRRSAMLGNCNLLDNVGSPDGFYSLHVVEQMLLWENVFFAPKDRFPEGLADFLGITHQTSTPDSLRWLPRTNAMPLASIGQRPVFANPSVTLERLMQPQFDPRQTVYLPMEAKRSIIVTNQSVGTILNQRFRSHKIELDVETAHASLVVLSQTHYAPWRAFINGQPEQIWRANYAFQAVQVPAGRHKVELIYKDRFFEAGAAISLFSLCGWGYGLYRSRRCAPAPLESAPA